MFRPFMSSGGDRKRLMRVAEEVLEEEPRQVSGPVPAGTRSADERETTPAPPPPMDGAFSWADVTPSVLRLSTPGFARTTGAVAYRTVASTPSDLDVRLAFVLLHVDGESSLEDIAQLAGLPTEEVRARFLELLAMGLVDLRTR